MPAIPTPIEFPLAPSALQRRGVCAVHLVAAALMVAVAANGTWLLAGLLGIAASALRAWRRSRRAAGRRHLRWTDGELSLVNSEGEWSGLVRQAPLVLPTVILLDWQGPHGPEWLTLFADQAAADDLRRLRVQLRAWRRRPQMSGQRRCLD